MKFLVFGAGVLGCNLANNLFRAGKDVTLLARGPWADEIRRNGLRIKNTLSRRTAVNPIPVAAELLPGDDYDVIFVAVRYTQIETILETLRASLAKTMIFVGNNVRASETAALLLEKNVLFAFTSAAGHRESNYVASVDLRKITIGPLRNAPSQEALVQEIFAGTKYKVTYEPNMEDFLLCHAAFVLPAVFACYKTDGDLKKLKRDNAYLNRLIDANIEGYRAIRNAGHEILPDADKEFEDAAFAAEIGHVVGPVKTQFGYHLIKVEEKKDAAESSFDEVKEQIRRDVGLSVTDAQVERVLAGKPCSMDEDARGIIQKQGRLYTERLLSAAMEAGFDLKAIPVVMLGGGAAVVKRNVSPQDGLCRVFALLDDRVNAEGFERILGRLSGGVGKG